MRRASRQAVREWLLAYRDRRQAIINLAMTDAAAPAIMEAAEKARFAAYRLAELLAKEDDSWLA